MADRGNCCNDIGRRGETTGTAWEGSEEGVLPVLSMKGSLAMRDTECWMTLEGAEEVRLRMGMGPVEISAVAEGGTPLIGGGMEGRTTLVIMEGRAEKEEE